MTVVQNDSIADVKNDVAQECVNNIFSEVMNFDHYSDLAHDIAASIAVELKNRTFFTDDLELTQKQKDEVSFNLKREPKIATVSENGKVTTAPFLIEAEQVQDGDKEVDEVLENVDDDSDENSDE